MNGPSQQLQSHPWRLLRRALRAHDSGDLHKAERLYAALLRDHPDNFDALHGLGRIHYGRGRLDTALALFQTALQADLGRADGFASLGLVFHAMRQFERALVSYDEGLRLVPNDPELLNRRGVALLDLGRPLEALENFERVLTADPGHCDALGNRGNALLKLNRPAAALADYDTALQRALDNAQLLTNRAVALRRLDRPHEAVMSAKRALVQRPDFAQARFVESVARLTLGDFSGWGGYEARWSVGLLASQRRSFTAPLWLGEGSLDGKTILLHAEQGSGDTIQFVRYAPLLAARGATKIIVEVQRELVRLLSCIAGIAVVARGDILPPFDCHCPLLSLPLAFATELATIPAEVPYIAPADVDRALWRRRLPERRPLVGLAWSGARVHDNDLNRSLGFGTLTPLLDLPGLSFVSLQHDVREDDAPLLQARPDVLALGAAFGDFADTAAAIASLDAVVAVDTAVAHLAGAMGKPLFLLLPFAADFRWLRERQDSPWYPTARLYRQPRFGDWDGVIGTLRQDLRQDLTPVDLIPHARKLSA
ncbi:MAG TPA: tetratricopeptide repeat protein [Xanthobacteraceae bacterium]|nr:tetratricopeptide repeat protein [Xanthobacteraceae bacterium]